MVNAPLEIGGRSTIPPIAFFRSLPSKNRFHHVVAIRYLNYEMIFKSLVNQNKYYFKRLFPSYFLASYSKILSLIPILYNLHPLI